VKIRLAFIVLRDIGEAKKRKNMFKTEVRRIKEVRRRGEQSDLAHT
jgi:hypothetical protein